MTLVDHRLSEISQTLNNKYHVIIYFVIKKIAKSMDSKSREGIVYNLRASV